MKGRVPKISKDTWLQNTRAEPEGYAGGQTYIWITENNLTTADKPKYGLLEQILLSLYVWNHPDDLPCASPPLHIQ